MTLTRFTRFLVRGAATSLLFVSMSASAAGGPIVIGQAIDLSGPNGSIGRDYVAGIKTYFDMLNSSGGINGRRIQYVARDDQGDPKLSATATAELIEREHADYLLGGVGDETTKAVLDTPAFKRSGLVLFAPLAAADYANSARVLFWRPSYKQEIRHIFSHFGSLGINDVGIVYQDSAFNADAFGSLSDEIRERKMKLTGVARIGASGERAAQEAQRLARTRPGFILVIADTISTALFLKEYRKYDAQTFVAGTSLTNLSTLREVAGAKAAEWTVFSQVVPNPSRRDLGAASRAPEHDAKVSRRSSIDADAGRIRSGQGAGESDPAIEGKRSCVTEGILRTEWRYRSGRPVGGFVERQPPVELCGYRAVQEGQWLGVLARMSDIF